MGFIDKICEGCQTTFQALTNTRRYCDNCRYDAQEDRSSLDILDKNALQRW